MFHLKVFIGSPNNLATERNTLMEILKKLNEEFYFQGIVLDAFDYNALFSEPIPPQQSINQHIKKSDVIILLFGNRLGKGTLEEFNLAINLYDKGKIFNLMVYFKKMSDDPMNDLGSEAQAVLKFKKEIEDKIFFHEFKDNIEFEHKIIQHFRIWINFQKQLFEVIERYENNLDESLIETMKVPELPYTNEIIDLSQRDADEIQELEQKAFELYLSSHGSLHYQLGYETYYLIARKLFNEIKQNNFRLFRQKPFIFPIHQYLSKMIRDSEEKEIFIKILKNWLFSKEKVYPIARDFAAFELGMTKADGAREILLNSLMDKYEFPAIDLQIANYKVIVS